MRQVLVMGKVWRAARAMGVALAVAVCVPAVAQNSEQPQTQTPTQEGQAAPAGETLTAERLEQVWAEIQERTREAPAEVRANLERIHNEAARALAAISEHLSEIARQEERRLAAPTDLEALRAELAAPAADVQTGLPEQPTVEQAQAVVTAAQSELQAARARQQELEGTAARRTARREAIPGDLAKAREDLARIGEQRQARPEETPELAQLRTLRHQAERREARLRIQRFETELAKYDARRPALQAHRDLTVRRISNAERLVAMAQSALDGARQRDAQRRAEEARRAVVEAADAHPVIVRLAERNAEIATIRSDDRGVVYWLERVARGLTLGRADLSRVRQQFLQAQRLVSQVGLTNTIGQMLRDQRTRLPDTRELRRISRIVQGNLSDAILQQYELEDERRLIADREAAVAREMEGVGGVGGDERAAIENAVRQLLRDRIELLDQTIEEYSEYQRQALEAETVLLQLIAVTQEFEAYIAERVLWIRSAPVVSRNDFPGVLGRVRWLVSPSGWVGEPGKLLFEFGEHPWRPLTAIAVTVFLALLDRRMRRTKSKRSMGALADASIWPLVHGALTLMVGALHVPVLLWVLGWLLESPVDASEQARAVAAGLKATAVLYVGLRFLRILCRSGGFATTQLQWRDQVTAVVRRHLRWFTPLALPAQFLAATMATDERGAWTGSLARLAYVVLMTALALFLFRIFRPNGPVMAQIRQAGPGGWLDRLRVVWAALLVAAPLSLAGLALAGYVYTTVELGWRFEVSMWVVLLVIVMQSILLRWLMMARRRMELEQARQRRAAAESKSETPEGESRPAAVEQPDLGVIDTQTRRLFRSAVAVTAFIALWFIWADALPALRILERVEVFPRFGAIIADSETVAPSLGLQSVEDEAPRQDQNGAAANGGRAASGGGASPGAMFPGLAPQESGGSAESAPVADDGGRVTLANVVFALLVVLLTLAASRNLPGLLEISLLQRLEMDNGAKTAITTLVRYTIAIGGILLAFSVAGLGWSRVQWLAAALTFGLAFGLQEIVANFVSGLIILFERPIRVGDTVTVGDVSGEISKIRIRATTITDWDRKELLVPNKEFITGRVINWTLSDPTLRVRIPVGIAYGSDVRKATELLLKAADDCPHVMREPAPQALFLGFGASSLDMEARVFIPHMKYFILTRDSMHRMIDDAFREAGVEISFPQRDLHIRTVSDSASKALERIVSKS